MYKSILRSHWSVIMLILLLSVTFSASIGYSAFEAAPQRELYLPKSQEVIEPQLLNIPDNDRVKVWIYFTDKGVSSQDELNDVLVEAEKALTEAASKRRAKTRGDNLVDFLDVPINDEFVNEIGNRGVEIVHRVKWLNAVSAYVDAKNLESVSSLPFVRRIERVKALGKSIDRIDSADKYSRFGDITEYSYNYGPSESQLLQINVPPAHELGFDGTGIIVCMLDTGYRKGHIAFDEIFNDSRLIAEWDFINNDGDTDWEMGDPYDQPNHGTYTWSALGGEYSGSLYGPSFNAEFLLAKTEDVSQERHIEEDNWAAAALWADSVGAQVISASLGYRWFDEGQGDYEYSDLDGNTTIVTVAADLAAYNGIAVCTAMGNEGWMGNGSLIAPADGDSVIACGAVNSEGEIASFSSRGPTYDDRTKPEVTARGVDTECANPYNLDGFTDASGTSLSTPLVGGTAGAILSAHPNWTPMMVREALMMTADNADNPNNTYGWGVVNAAKAIYYHPEGDIVFDMVPLPYVAPLNEAHFSGEITCSQGINPSSVTLYWNHDGSQNYNSIQMNNDQDTYSADIPTPGMGESLYYYVYAEKTNGLNEVYPVGAPNNRFITEASTPQFVDDFENGPFNWETGGSNDRWGLSATHSNSGNLAFHDSPQGNYANNADCWMAMKAGLDFTDASNIQLSFYHRYNLQNGSDYVYIEGSDDGGNNWTQIGSSITGTQESFVQAIHSLDSFAGASEFMLRFRLDTNSSTSRDGWFVDDVIVTWELPQPDCCCDVNMIPDDDPVIVPPGGSFGLTGIISNVCDTSITTDVWGGVIYDGDFYRQFGYNNLPLDPGQTLSAHTSQHVPGFAPQGSYVYIAYCGDRPDDKCDSAQFDFTVSGAISNNPADSWFMEGDFVGEHVPSQYSLIGNYPNPFNAQTSIIYTLPQGANVKLDVYNLAGQQVVRLFEGYNNAGEHSVTWDASGYSSGIYFYKLSAGDKVFTKRMTLLK